MNALGIIFADHYSDHYAQNELTHARAAASLPYGGRYRSIDFILSSMVNAGVREIGILASANYGSLVDHLGSGADWDLNRRNGGIVMLTPLARPEAKTVSYRGRLDALRAVKGYIADCRHQWVVLSFGGTVANLDLEAMMNTHLANDAYLTVAYSEIPANVGEAMLTLDNENRVTALSYLLKADQTPHPYAIGTYLIRRTDLLEFLDTADNNDATNLNRALVQQNLTTHRIFGYQHTGFTRIIQAVEDYFAANMDLLEDGAMADLFTTDRPVYTKIKDSVPVFYDYNAAAENCIIADGCTICGTVRNSVIFRGVTVEEGAVVENAILMQDTVIRKGAHLSFGITDKDVVVEEGVTLRGTAGQPFVIRKGKVVQ